MTSAFLLTLGAAGPWPGTTPSPLTGFPIPGRVHDIKVSKQEARIPRKKVACTVSAGSKACHTVSTKTCREPLCLFQGLRGVDRARASCWTPFTSSCMNRPDVRAGTNGLLWVNTRQKRITPLSLLLSLSPRPPIISVFQRTASNQSGTTSTTAWKQRVTRSRATCITQT